MNAKNVADNINNTYNFLNSFCLETQTCVLKDHVPICIVKENNVKKIFYSYNSIDGYKYKVIVKNRSPNVDNNKFIISSLDHPYILKLIHYCEYASSSITVFEFFSETNLYTSKVYNTQYDESTIKNIIYQIILTVNYLHSKNLVHKNLHLQSFLIKSINNELMIKLEDIHKIILNSSKSHKTMRRQNVYSIGIIMYFLIFGKYPNLYMNNKEEIFSSPSKLWESVSKKGQHFLKTILLNGSSSMITTKEALYHDWFKENVNQTVYINYDVLQR
uniref:Protein kinase domain-containing protein n=1 Tax=Piliocolobus tephrosceles TaxID=591936 RepID=A0A8C9LS15_9PRIM